MHADSKFCVAGIANEYIHMICEHVNQETKNVKEEELANQAEKDAKEKLKLSDTVFPGAQATRPREEKSTRRSRSPDTESLIPLRDRSSIDKEQVQPNTI